jgi:hypothetical protein
MGMIRTLSNLDRQALNCSTALAANPQQRLQFSRLGEASRLSCHEPESSLTTRVCLSARSKTSHRQIDARSLRIPTWRPIAHQLESTHVRRTVSISRLASQVGIQPGYRSDKREEACAHTPLPTHAHAQTEYNTNKPHALRVFFPGRLSIQLGLATLHIDTLLSRAYHSNTRREPWARGHR